MTNPDRPREGGRPGRRRGPSHAKTAATRNAILHAALSAFLDKGYEATRMDDVARLAGVSKGTTYLHFADKAALFSEALRQAMRLSVLDGRIMRPRRLEPTHAFLKRAVLPALDHVEQGGWSALFHIVASEHDRFPELAWSYDVEVVQPTLRLVRAYARRAERRGELVKDSLSRFPLLLVAPIVVTSLSHKVFSRDAALGLADVFDTYLDMLFLGPPTREKHKVF